MLASLSLVQAVSIWSDLEKAYRGDASHGDTAEIYMYRLMPWSPTVASAPPGASQGSGIYGKACREAYDTACGALHDLLLMFKQSYQDAYVEVDGREFGEWLKEARLEHRAAVRVVRTDKPTLTQTEKEAAYKAGWEASEAAAEQKLRENPRFEALDYVFIPEKDGRYRVEHSFYPSQKTHYTAEEVLNALRTCASFNLYAVVTFNDGLILERRKK